MDLSGVYHKNVDLSHENGDLTNINWNLQQACFRSLTWGNFTQHVATTSLYIMLGWPKGDKRQGQGGKRHAQLCCTPCEEGSVKRQSTKKTQERRNAKNQATRKLRCLRHPIPLTKHLPSEQNGSQNPQRRPGEKTTSEKRAVMWLDQGSAKDGMQS